MVVLNWWNVPVHGERNGGMLYGVIQRISDLARSIARDIVKRVAILED